MNHPAAVSAHAANPAARPKSVGLVIPDISAGAAMGPPQLVTGVNYLPPNSAGMAITVPFANDQQHGVELSAAQISRMPTEFNWADPTMAKKRLAGFQSSWIREAPNQARCGSCWAVSSTSVLRDRLSLSRKETMPNLSAVKTASCGTRAPGADGCQGGFPGNAGCFFEQVGVPADSCWPYAQFCGPTGGGACNTTVEPWACCGAGGGPSPFAAKFSGDVRTTCEQFGGRGGTHCGRHPGNPDLCLSHSKEALAKAIPGSTVSLAAGTEAAVVQRMKEHIYAGGPVVSTYWVLKDFMVPSMFPSWGWKMTGGIYANSNPSPYSKDPFVANMYQARNGGGSSEAQQALATVRSALGVDPGQFSSLASFQAALSRALNSIDGAHAVTVTGWGQAEVKGMGIVPYWEVRNSWGTRWNGNGYFKFALTDNAKQINQYTSMERAVGQHGNLIGGATSFRTPGRNGKQAYHPQNDVVNADGSVGSKTAWWVWAIVGGLVLVTIVMFVLLLKVHKTAKTNKP